MRMKQFRLWMLVVLLLIPSAALGAEELAVWQTNIRMYDDLPVGRIFAKVQNTGDAPFGMGGAGLPPVFVPTSELVKTVRWHPHSFLGLATS